MNFKYTYWFFEQVLSDKFCDALIKHGNEQKESLALTGDRTDLSKLTQDEKLDLIKTRDSNIVWLSDQWIYKEIQPYINLANKNASWNFDWDYSEACQFTKYKLNQHYSWHKDSFNKPYGDEKMPNYRNKVRKLSVTCILSNPDDYEGGELEFQPRDQTDPNMVLSTEHLKKRGTVIVFPSYTWHRVKPITKGTRYSLVVWNIGYPFK
jgi:PKHD-type hydroxylase